MVSRHMLWQTRITLALRYKDEFAYEFVNSRGRAICTPWYHTRARPPCHTSGAAPDGRALPAGYDGERAHTLTIRGQGIHRCLEMLQCFATVPEWLAQGVLECDA